MKLHSRIIAVLAQICCLQATAQTSCSQTTCKVGDRATTYSQGADIFFACPTRELSEYTAVVLGLVSMHLQVTGKSPVLSSVTGEPQYKGETQTILDTHRKAAGVSSYMEAKAKCAAGLANRTVRIEELAGASKSMLVAESNGRKYWMSKSHADLRQ